jgi:hypothetical protein
MRLTRDKVEAAVWGLLATAILGGIVFVALAAWLVVMAGLIHDLVRRDRAT